MKIIKRPRKPWEDIRFRCEECGCVVQFELADLSDLAVGLRRPQPTMSGGWSARATCPVCRRGHSLFQEARDDDAD